MAKRFQNTEIYDYWQKKKIMNESSEIGNTMSQLNNTNNIQYICHYVAGWQKGGRP